MTKEVAERLSGMRLGDVAMERVNCRMGSKTGHTECGWCMEHMRPRCRCLSECKLQEPQSKNEVNFINFVNFTEDVIETILKEKGKEYAKSNSAESVSAESVSAVRPRLSVRPPQEGIDYA